MDDLKRSEEIYRNIFNNSPLGILHFDKLGRVTDCNNEFASIIGTEKENLIGFNMLTQLNRIDFKEVIKNYFINGYGYFKNDYTSVLTGKTTPIVARFNAIYSNNNEIIGGVGLVEDVTDRTKNEKLQKALFEISETASKTISMKDLYKELHQIIEKLMSAKNIFVAMHNSQTNVITFPYHVDEYDSTPEPQIFGSGLTEYILRTKKSQIITAEVDKKLQKSGEVALSGEFSQVWVGI